MADNNTNRDNQASVAEDDPFAELARIMNRGAQGDTPAPADDHSASQQPDFDASDGGASVDLDLERELMGELDDGYADEPAASGDGYSEEPVALEDDALGDEPTAQEIALADDEQADDADYRYAAEDAGREEAPPAAPADDEWQPAYATQADDLPPAAGDWDHAESLNMEPAGEWQPVSADARSFAADGDAVLADVDMDFGDLDSPDDARLNKHEEMRAYDAEDMGQPAEAQGAVSLEDELETLLTASSASETYNSNGEDAGYAGEQSDDRRDAQDSGFPEPAQPPQSSIFGRANFSGADDAMHEHEFAEGDEQNPDDDDARHADAPEQAQEVDPFAALSSLGADTTAAAPLDFETVEVPEPALAQADDLELPDLPEDVPTGPVPEDDFDGQFAYEIPAAPSHREQPAQISAASSDDAGADIDDDRFYSEALGFAAARNAADDPFDADMDRELDEAMAMPGALASRGAEKPNRRGAYIVAGAVLGIALLGGIGAFALSFGGGDETGTPVLVQADSEPMKVKPDDPGGVSTVPNQDSVAYEAAAGGTDGAPTQESLLSANEEPVNIASRTIGTDRLPGVDDELSGEGASGKASDRLAANSSETGQEISDEVIAVQPRRVRTMIVRPDGTLVPREEETPAAAPEPAPAETVAAAEPAASTLIVAEPAAVPETAETIATEEPVALPGIPIETVEDEPVVETVEEIEEPAPQPVETAAAEPADPVTPRVGPVAASRPADQGAAQPQRVAQAAPAVTRTEPAAPAAAVATTGSEWSMQIASQPSAESAQATYQDLARRYGDLLGGRGVNIVRADIPGKGTYYRVRIPTSSRNDGVALCERYKAVGGSCFVSK